MRVAGAKRGKACVFTSDWPRKWQEIFSPITRLQRAGKTIVKLASTISYSRGTHIDHKGLQRTANDMPQELRGGVDYRRFPFKNITGLLCVFARMDLQH